MASIIIHLAVTSRVIEECSLGEREAILKGSILPDYTLKPNHHYRDKKGEKEFFNITLFRKDFKNKLHLPLYLGYYLHLVQDVVFRNFIYNIHSWSPQKEKVKRLYGDYTALNGYLTQKYSLPMELLDRMEELREDEYPDFILNREELLFDNENYHRKPPVLGYEYFFLTPEMVEEYITLATEVCKKELNALKGVTEHINEVDFGYFLT